MFFTSFVKLFRPLSFVQVSQKALLHPTIASNLFRTVSTTTIIYPSSTKAIKSWRKKRANRNAKVARILINLLTIGVGARKYCHLQCVGRLGELRSKNKINWENLSTKVLLLKYVQYIALNTSSKDISS